MDSYYNSPLKQQGLNRFIVPGSAPLMKLPVDEALAVLSALEGKSSTPFCSKGSRVVPLSLMGLTECSDSALTLFRCAYPEFFFERSVLDLGGFAAGRSLLECDSGNNNLGFFRVLERFFANNNEEHNYHISNYSGGRGDYFGMHQLALVHNEEQRLVAPKLPEITLENICSTFGGQGAFRLVASYLRKSKQFSSIVVADSTYCNVYAPFLAENLKVEFAQTSHESTLPNIEQLEELLDRPGCAGFQYVRFHNPSGESLSEEQLEKVMIALEERRQYLIYGETYEQLSFEDYDSKYLQVLKVAERIGFSRLIRIKTIAKDRGLAGFRAGYIIAPSEVVRFGIQYNSLLAFNPPMTNTRLLVANAYLSAAHFLGIRLTKVEDYLKISQDTLTELLSNFSSDISAQKKILSTNVQYLISRLFNKPSSSFDLLSNSWIENDNFRMYIPSGGINALIELPVLSIYDEIDLVRKTYLLTGLILHTSSFLNHRTGMHIRVTLSQSRDTLSEAIEALEYVIANTNSLKLLPKDSFKLQQN